MITVTVDILGKPYQINCPKEHEPLLLEAGRDLDKRMREMKYKGHVVGLERIAIITALNLSYELLQAERSQMSLDLAPDTVVDLRDQIDAELRKIRELHE